jgi:hypothetical protein
MNRHRCDRDKDYASQHFAEFYTHLCAKQASRALQLQYDSTLQRTAAQGTFPVATMRAHKAKMSDVLLTVCPPLKTAQAAVLPSVHQYRMPTRG